ncbi:MAG TPA: hypothetical protein PKC70_16690, partial [Cellvibrionaceae bacterium]|nr:hypothetical protein [Cellvibrionaceae bacterium]
PVVALETADSVLAAAETPEEKATATPAATAPQVSQGGARASNDPRINPKPIKSEVLHVAAAPIIFRALDTTLPAAIERQPRDLQRPSNDPRSLKQKA